MPEQLCSSLDDEIGRRQADGWRLDMVYPADAPHSARLSRGGEQVILTSRPGAPRPAAELPPFIPAAMLVRADSGAAEGRAGMLYRDLIPGRLGGRYIASQIRVERGGPVADWVHYHRVALQLICVTAGSALLVYEDQGAPFVAAAGDIIVQPPGIRHRVLESSAGLSVVEIGCPALHETFADHELVLPTGTIDRERDFGGQRFLHHVAASAAWTPFHGGEARETAVGQATGGLAEVRAVRAAGSGRIAVPPHDGELVFGFVSAGSAMLGGDRLVAGDAFVIPPRDSWQLSGMSGDFQLLHVTTAHMPARLPGDFA